MLTIFAIPKAFVGHNAIIQRNAIQSWLQLDPKCEIIIFGDEDGVANVAREYDIAHFPKVEKNVFGTPLLSSAFQTAQRIAKNDILLYVNGDIIIFQHIVDAIQKINLPRFLVCGRRWDLDINHEINFNNGNWENNLFQEIKKAGTLHSISGLDYFVFKRNSVHMLPFAVGRPGWDNWLIYDMRYKNIPVIDASEAIKIIHQNHDFSHSKFGERERVGGPEWQENIKIAGGLTHMLTLRDTDWLLTEKGLERPAFPRAAQSILALWYPWRLILAAKRKLQVMNAEKRSGI